MLVGSGQLWQQQPLHATGIIVDGFHTGADRYTTMHAANSFDAARDVPDHLRKYLTTVTSPDDVYTEQRRLAERRLRFLYRRFLNQINYGCKNPGCDVPTCLSYRTRVFGGVIRPYTDASARALATQCIEDYASRVRDSGRHLRRGSQRHKHGTVNDGLCWNEPVVPWYTHPDEPRGKPNAGAVANGHVVSTKKHTPNVEKQPDLENSLNNGPSPGNGVVSNVSDGRQELGIGQDRKDTASFAQTIFDRPELREVGRPSKAMRPWNGTEPTRDATSDEQQQLHSGEVGTAGDLDARHTSSKGKQKQRAADREHELHSRPIHENDLSMPPPPPVSPTHTFKLLSPRAIAWLRSMSIRKSTPSLRSQGNLTDHQAPIDAFIEQSLYFVLSDARRLMASAAQWNEPTLRVGERDNHAHAPRYSSISMLCADLTLCAPRGPHGFVPHILKSLDHAYMVPISGTSSGPTQSSASTTFLTNEDVARLLVIVAAIAHDTAMRSNVPLHVSRSFECSRQTHHLLVGRFPAAVSKAISFRVALDVASRAQPQTRQQRSIVRSITKTIQAAESTDQAQYAGALLGLMQAVLQDCWDRKPVIPRASAVGGALEMLRGLYQVRLSIGLHDSRFVLHFLDDVFDEIEMPYAWHRFRPDSIRVHILQYPFVFPPAMLVSYFRSLNFKLMKLSHEKALGSYANAKAQLVHAHWQARGLEEVLEKTRPHMARFFVMTIRRDHVLEDAFGQIWHRERQELARPLRVKLGQEDGEEGLDHGGVQQELFRLIFAEAFDEKYGLFTTDPRTHTTWFRPASLEPLYKYEALGILMSLAVYNGVIVPITMPLAFYRKILGLKVKTTDHIRDGWPDLARSFDQLLEWDQGDVADDIGVTYEFSYDAFGSTVTMDMTETSSSLSPSFERTLTSPNQPVSKQSSASQLRVPCHSNGQPTEAPPVTNENRQAFVKDYIAHLTDITVRAQFAAFLRGLHTLLSPQSLTIFTPAVLKQLVEGQPADQPLDLKAWQAITEYDNGYTLDCPMIIWFWDILRNDFSQEQLRSLLAFVTASDRLPVGGWAGMTFVIQKNGDDSDGRLPTSSTCYGKLLLPQYSSREVLKDRLEWAVGQAWGFWMV